MADELIQQTAPETNTEIQTQAAPEMDLAAHMRIALNGGIDPQSTETQTTTESSQEAGAAAITPDAATSDPFGLFKEKFGYETPDAAIKEIEELRAFKAQPRLPEFTVPDTESAAILRALAAGKKEDVWKALDHEMRIERLLTSEVNKDSAGDIVKMGMALKYKDLTPDEINYKFNKQFAIPPKPTQALEEDEADFQQRLNQWQDVANDKQMELMIEAKLAKPELQNAKGKLEIPDIETPVDEGYIQYKQMLEERARMDEEAKVAYQKLTPEAIETKLNFKDEANKIAFEFQFKPDADMFNKAVDIAANAEKFWGLFQNSDGTPNQKLFLKSIMYALDENKVLLSAMNQTKNATIKASLPDNTEGGLVRQMPQSQEPNELDQKMQQALAGYVRSR
jgi:hypothetical protein